MPCLVTLSQNELHRLGAIQKIHERRLSVIQAAELLRLSRAQVHRLLQSYDRDGAAGLASKRRGQPSNRRHTEDFRNAALDLVREHYVDFGPTLACEKLLERHRVGLSKETLRQWMMEAGIWKSRRERKKQLHQPRGRRDCFGELVQIDGSHHWWFEDRGAKCTLLVYIDDATGKLLHLRFAGSENTFDYLIATKAYLREWGKANVTSLVERVSRFTVFLRNNDRQSKPIMDGLIDVLGALPHAARRSMPFDRGTEFTDWPYLQAGLGVQTWFCDPQAPWQKGTVENTNRRARRWLSRDTDPLSIEHQHLHQMCAHLNSTPRKCLGFKTPAEVFRHKLLAATR
jgi:IS30 family transposase